jgi:hypothetical protein
VGEYASSQAVQWLIMIINNKTKKMGAFAPTVVSAFSKILGLHALQQAVGLE